MYIIGNPDIWGGIGARSPSHWASKETKIGYRLDPKQIRRICRMDETSVTNKY